MSDPNRIRNETELRELLGEPSPLVEQKIFHETLDEFSRAFIEASPLVLMATADAAGALDVSPKGDQPGFCAVLDAQTVAVPDRSGNKLAYGHLNVLANPKIGLIFLVPGARETLRVNGRAELTRDPALLERLSARGKPALLATRVTVEESFFHCGKAFIRSELWKPDTWPKDFRAGLALQMSRKISGNDELEPTIEDALEKDYRENL